MNLVGRILEALGPPCHGRRGVTSAEYAILAVGVVIVVGGAIIAFDLNNPLVYAGSNLVAGQASLAAR
jgi:hypothetical protein